MNPETVPAVFERLDERFADCGGDEHLDRLFTGGRWLEGPVYVPAGRYVLFSDIPNDRMLRWDETSGHVSVFRSPAGYTNGHTLDGQGRLVSCEQGNRRVTRTEHDGSITTIADSWQGKRLNSPNDVVVRSDGSIWFTDPPYGIDSNYEGHRAESEIGGWNVYRVDPDSGRCEVVADDFLRPNGLAFSLDEGTLYVADTRRNHIRAFEVADGGLRGDGPVLCENTSGVFDGLRLDHQGRIWAATREGLHCFAPDGTRIGKLLVPEMVSNLAFGGAKRNRIFICATTSLYSMYMSVDGAPPVYARGR